jgi:chromosome segregation ATPase
MSIYDSLKSHLENQPYAVLDEDGDEIDFSSEVDEDGDITVEVDLSHLRNRIADLETEVTDLEEEVANLEKEIAGQKSPAQPTGDPQ